jgi:hypothetical protein
MLIAIPLLAVIVATIAIFRYRAHLERYLGESPIRWALRTGGIGLGVLLAIGFLLYLLPVDLAEGPPGRLRSPVIHTDTCFVSDVAPEVSDHLYVNKPFDVFLSLSAGSLNSSSPPFAPGQKSCPVTAQLTVGSASGISIGQTQIALDLATSVPQWSVVVDSPGVYTLFISLNSAVPCVTTCRSPIQLPVEVTVDRDPDAEAVRVALDDISSHVTSTVHQQRRLRKGRPEVVDLQLLIPARPTVLQRDCTVTLKSSTIPESSDPVLRDLSSGSSVLVFPVVVTPAAAHPSDSVIKLVFECVSEGGKIDAGSTIVAHIDVAKDGLFNRIIVTNLGWIGAAIAVISALGAASGVIRRAMRSRHDDDIASKGNSEPPSDDRGFL